MEKESSEKEKKEKNEKSDSKADIKDKPKEKKEKNKEKKGKEKTEKCLKEEKVKNEDVDVNMQVPDAKPIGIPVEAINVEDYTAPDPLTVADSLKQDEEMELRTMKELRAKNLEKLKTNNIEGPYCLCRKPIDAFMVRCNLCFEWYHSSCIVGPKTVHGKPIGKGFTAWSASREVRYICMLCCRSRRPRIDTILSLLMSLQKLPVRVAEGEALQFLTERSMNWQDRAKQTLSNSEIQRVLNEVKQQSVVSTDNKQTTSGSNVTQTAIIQKLISVQKVQEVKLEEVDSVTKMEIDSNVKIETESSNVSMEKLDTSKSTRDIDAELECTEQMSGSPVANKDVKDPLATHPHVNQLQSGESSRAHSPIDVCTPIENMPSKQAKDTVTKVITMAPLPDPLLDRLEELMFEGDLLEVGLDEVPIMWALLQIQRPLLKEDVQIMVCISKQLRPELLKRT